MAFWFKRNALYYWMDFVVLVVICRVCFLLFQKPDQFKLIQTFFGTFFVVVLSVVRDYLAILAEITGFETVLLPCCLKSLGRFNFIISSISESQSPRCCGDGCIVDIAWGIYLLTTWHFHASLCFSFIHRHLSHADTGSRCVLSWYVSSPG